LPVSRHRRVRGDHSVEGQELQVRFDIRAERHFNDVIDAFRSDRSDTIDHVGPSAHHVLCARSPSD